MGSPLVSIDGVGIGVDALGIGVGPLHCYFESDLALSVLCFKRNNLRVNDIAFLSVVEILDVIHQAFFVVVAVLSISPGRPLVVQINAKTLIEEGHLLEAGPKGFILEIHCFKDCCAGPERNDCPGFTGFSCFGERSLWHTVSIGLSPGAALATNLHVELLGQRVHHTATHPVETAGDGIPTAAKLSSGMQGGKDDLHRRPFFYGMLVDGNASAVIGDLYRTVRLNGHSDEITMAGKRFIYRVVDNFIHQMMQTSRTGRPDIHTRAFTHRLKPLKYLDIARAVRVFFGRFLGRWCHRCCS